MKEMVMHLLSQKAISCCPSINDNLPFEDNHLDWSQIINQVAQPCFHFYLSPLNLQLFFWNDENSKSTSHPYEYRQDFIFLSII